MDRLGTGLCDDNRPTAPAFNLGLTARARLASPGLKRRTLAPVASPFPACSSPVHALTPSAPGRLAPHPARAMALMWRSDMTIQQQISVVTLGVADLERSKRFYGDGFGWTPVFENEEIVFFQMNGFVLGLAAERPGRGHAAPVHRRTRGGVAGPQRPHRGRGSADHRPARRPWRHVLLKGRYFRRSGACRAMSPIPTTMPGTSSGTPLQDRRRRDGDVRDLISAVILALVARTPLTVGVRECSRSHSSAELGVPGARP